MRALATGVLVTFLAVSPTAAAVSLDVSDLDGDGLANAQEDTNENHRVDPGETNYLRADTDGGGESDGSEVRFGRDPFDPDDDLTADPDGDGLPNGLELQRGTDRNTADTDGDGVNDADDPFPLEKAFKTDADRDGIADEWEVTHKFDPTKSVDASLDADSDGLSNRNEFIADTDPRQRDTDRDGTPDGQEIRRGSDPDESLCLEYGTGTGASVTFTDTTGHFAADAIGTLSALRVLPQRLAIISGYDDGQNGRVFLPDRPVTRLEFLKMALLSSCIDLEEAAVGQSTGFSDLALPLTPDSSGDLFLRYRLVQTGFSHGIIQGYLDGTFRPDAPISRAEAVKLLLVASRLSDIAGLTGAGSFSDVPADAWFAPSVDMATTLGIIRGYDDGFFRPEQSITRGEAALIILRTIRVNPSVNGDVLP